jgi:hypothetical protein
MKSKRVAKIACAECGGNGPHAGEGHPYRPLKTYMPVLTSQAYALGVKDCGEGICKVYRDSVTSRLVWDEIDTATFDNPDMWAVSYIAGWTKVFEAALDGALDNFIAGVTR